MKRLVIPGLFITATDTEVGKTVVAAAIAEHLRRGGKRVAVCKPVATGCPRRREGLVSEDAEFLAACADARHPLDVICPQRFAEPLAPAIAAQRIGKQVDEAAIEAAMTEMAAVSDVMIVEGVGGIMVPTGISAAGEGRTVLNWAVELGLPAVVVARPGLGTINHTLLTVGALRQASVKVAGVVINRYPAGTAPMVEETNPRVIEKWGKVPVLCLVPDEPVTAPRIGPGIRAAIDQVDWWGLAMGKRAKG
jgi:dethiobiotin synthetase